MNVQTPRRAAMALIDLMNASASGKQKLVASIIACVLGAEGNVAEVVFDAMEMHHLPVADNNKLAMEIGIRLETFRQMPKSKGDQRLLEKVLASDRTTLRLARMIAETELVETTEGTRFAAPISLLKALPIE